MRAQLNPRLLVLVSVLAALALGLSFLTLQRPEPSGNGEPSEQSALRSPGRPQNASQARRDARKRAPARPQKTQRTPAVPPRAGQVRKPVRNDLPAPIAQALARHTVVVASVVTPGAEVDDIALTEARAGAALGGAGFVAVDVLNEAVATKLATTVDGLETPSVLVFRRPGRVAVRIDGFSDRQTVAQAATNAAG